MEVIHNHDHDILVTMMRWKDLPDNDRGDFRCRRAVDSFSKPRILISVIKQAIILGECLTTS